MAVTLHGLTCFIAAAKTLSFSRAAKELRASPSSVSDQIAKLENDVNRRLFDRNARSVSLTRAGEELLPLAEQVLVAVGAIKSWSSGRHETVLDVGIAVASRRFRAVLSAAAQRIPDVALRMHTTGFSGALPALSNRQLDCAFIVQMERVPHPEWVYAIPLGSEGFVVVLPTTHPLAEREWLSPGDLEGERLIAGASPRGADDAGATWYSQIDPRLPTLCRILSLVDGPDEAMELVAAGVGINIAGESIVDAYGRTGLSFVPLRVQARLHTFFVARNEAASPGLRALARLATEVANYEGNES